PKPYLWAGQAEHPLYANVREEVVEVNGVPVEGKIKGPSPYYVLKHDLLYRIEQIRGEEVEQLLVPRKHIRAVLELAHSHLFGGHLGVDKTLDRILRRLYWPGIWAEVQRYCASCPECQLHSPRPHLPLPIIDVLFERIAMDIVGPLEKSHGATETCHRLVFYHPTGSMDFQLYVCSLFVMIDLPSFPPSKTI
uniref:Gypsy retrotransposon integrase-like protein 1 n=1 Tax=Chelonoidis abingdonii TaxID=106734 RepID=A0A8C0INR0_CHEAB